MPRRRNLPGSRIPHAGRPGSDEESNSSYRNSRDTRDDITDSSSEEGLGEYVTSRSRESNSDSSNDPYASTAHRINRMGGLGRAAGEMFVNRPAQRAEEDRARRREEARLESLRRTEQPQGNRRRGQVSHHEDRLGDYAVRTDSYTYHAQMDGNGRLRRLSEMGEDGRGHRLSLRRLGRENPDGSSAFSDTESDEPTAPRDYEGRGISARGDDYDDGYSGPSTPRGHGDRAISARRDEYDDDDYEGPSTPRGYGSRRMSSRRDYDDY